MPLTSPLLLVLLAVVAEALLFVALRRDSSRTRLTRIGSGALAGVLLLLGAAAWANDHYGLYRSWRDLAGVHSPDLVAIKDPGAVAAAVAPTAAKAGAKRGTLLELDIPGGNSGVQPRRAFVYLPPQYRDPLYASTTFPVIEAFQGSPGRPSDWILGLHLEQEMDRAINVGAMQPAIVVVPDTNGGLARSLECTDTADGKNSETFLVRDVRGWLGQNFRVRPGRWVAIGYSTGGYCALDLALRHPTAYASAISLDGYIHAISDRYARGLWKSAQDKLEHSPDWWVLNRPPQKVDIYLLAGRDDAGSVHDATRLWDLLGRTGWRRPRDMIVFQDRGRHTFPAWQAALPGALQWALPGRNAAPPVASALAPVAPAPRYAPRPSPRATPRRSPTASPAPRPRPSHRTTRPSPSATAR